MTGLKIIKELAHFYFGDVAADERDESAPVRKRIKGYFDVAPRCFL